ncbi:MAG: tmk 1 [Verrucomicrobiales bacterium]|nr:tmk 1 [Verrucomicrobiales bacterium]
MAVEGIDGAGKTSVSALLAQWCGERGIACTYSKEPTGLKWGQELRRSAKEGRLTMEEELRLFELDRREHISRAIQPALDAGGIVILDRYYWSTAAYQGARGADVAKIM